MNQTPIPKELDAMFDECMKKHREMIVKEYREEIDALASKIVNLRFFLSETHPELDHESIESIEDGTYHPFNVSTN